MIRPRVALQVFSALFLCASALFAADTPTASTPPAKEDAAALETSFSRSERHSIEHLSQEALSAHIRFLADDLLEGREPGTRGDQLATRYLAAQLEQLGIAPFAPAVGSAPRSYFQSVPIVELKAQVPETVAFTPANGSPLLLSTRDGDKAELVLSADAHVDKASIEKAELVFAGYGIVAPEYGWDDYKDVDVKGKIVVLLNFNPPFAGEVDGKKVRLWYGRWDYKYLTAAAHGAIGALIIHSTESAGYPWRVLSHSAGPEAVRLDLPPVAGEPRMQFRGWLEGGAAAKLVKQGGQDLPKLIEAAQSKSFKAVPLGLTTSFSMPISRRTIESANVIGVIPGSDPALRDEAIVYSAHHDHLGMRPPIPPSTDGIYNGALDNASGCAAVLTIARATAWNPPRRSTIFLFTTGEEEGLLGARYFAQHPPIPPGKMAVNLNIDVINIFGKTDDLTILGIGKSSVDDIVRAVAKAEKREVHGDASPNMGSFYRSDHFELARIGVPVASLEGGRNFHGRPKGWGQQQIDAWIEKNYHQVTDEYRGDWDLSGAMQDLQLQLVVGLRIGNALELPHWTPGDEFEAARKSSQK